MNFTPSKIRRFFADAWAEPRDRQLALRTMHTLHETFARHGVDYVICYGTLLGFARHGGLIPWDDDIDISIDRRCETQFLRALPDLAEAGILHATFWPQRYYKIFPDEGHEIARHAWKWPFVDIFFYDQSESDLVSFRCSRTFPYRASDIFPLQTAGFDEIEVSVPAQPCAVLDDTFPGWAEYCISSSYCHRREQRIRRPRRLKRAKRDDVAQVYPLLV